MTTLPTTSSIRLPRAPGPGGQVLAMPSAAIGPAMAQGQEPLLTPADILRVIRSNFWLILIAMIVSGGLAFGLYMYQLNNNPRYQAEGLVVVNRTYRMNPLTNVIERPEEFTDLKVEMRTQTKMLMHKGLWDQVIETNPRFRELPWFVNFQKIGSSADAPKLARMDLTENFRVSPETDSKILKVTMEAPDPNDARNIIQYIVDAHIAEQTKLTYDRTNTELETAKQWRERYSRELQRVKEAMSRIDADLGGGGASQRLMGGLNIRELEISNLVSSKMKAQLDLNEAKGQLDAIQQNIQNGNDPPQVEMMLRGDQTVGNLKATVLGLEDQLDALADKGENSNYYKEYQKRLASARERLAREESKARATYRNQIVDSQKSIVQSLSIQEENLSTQVETRRAELAEMSGKIADYFSLKDERDGFKSLEREMYERVEFLKNELAGQSAGVQWYRAPTKPEERSSPKLSIYLPTGIALGAALALGIAFLREITNTTVRSPRDIAKVGSMNVLGMIADESDDPQLAGVPLHVVIGQAPHSIMAEQFRQVRTRLQHAASLDTTRTIVITSPGPGDGKSTVACNLAAGLALNGRRILLVDANFRRPELHRLFNVPNEVGFANVLDSVSNLESAVQKTTIPNLELLTAGPKASNPTELLESQLFSDFIDRSLEEYDHVIFDVGPLLVVSEAVALAPRVDGVITVVRAKVNTRGMLTRVRDTLKQIKAEHLGVVLNGVQTWGGGYYGRNIKTYYAYQNAE